MCAIVKLIRSCRLPSFQTKVLQVKQRSDFSRSGRWDVETENKSGEKEKHSFDAVMICVGHHCHPNLPLHDFPGTDRRAINNLPVYSRRRGAETLCTSGNLVQCDYVLTEGSTTQRVQLNILILGLRLHSKGCKVYFKCKLHQREIIFYAKSRMTLLSVLSEASTRSRESSSTAETTRPPMSGGTRRSS